MHYLSQLGRLELPMLGVAVDPELQLGDRRFVLQDEVDVFRGPIMVELDDVLLLITEQCDNAEHFDWDVHDCPEILRRQRSF